MPSFSILKTFSPQCYVLTATYYCINYQFIVMVKELFFIGIFKRQPFPQYIYIQKSYCVFPFGSTLKFCKLLHFFHGMPCGQSENQYEHHFDLKLSLHSNSVYRNVDSHHLLQKHVSVCITLTSKRDIR